MGRRAEQERPRLFHQPLQQARLQQHQHQPQREALALSPQHTKRGGSSKALLAVLALVLLLSHLSPVEARSLPTRLQSPQRRAGDYARRDGQLSQPLSQEGGERPSTWFGRRGSNLRDSLDQRDSASFPSVKPLGSTSDGDKGTKTLELVFYDSSAARKAVAKASSDNDGTPAARWGHTSTYLPSQDVVLIVGGQTSKSGNITNDVFALDVSELRSSNNQTSSGSSNKWTRLSSEGLPAHAFAASVLESKAGGNDLWLIGGVTQDCNTDAPAYRWTAPQGNLTQSKWTNVTLDNAPTRRRGASAVGIATSDSFMVVGGTADASVCYTGTKSGKEAQSYSGVDVWLPGRSSQSSVEVQSLAIDARLESMPLSNYATVVLPGNATASSGVSDRVVFLGGRDASGELAKLNRIWAMDLSTGGWGQLKTTGPAPSGREGLTAVLARDGRVVVHGGYVADSARPSSETYVLDLSRSPAVWSKATLTAESTTPPARAYHSAVMAGDVMVVAFGQEGRASRANVERDAAPAQVQFLDLSAGPEPWTWSDSMSSIAAMHATAAKPTSPLAHSADSSSSQTIKLGDDETESVSDSTQSTTSTAQTQSSNANSNSNASTSSNSKSNSNQNADASSSSAQTTEGKEQSPSAASSSSDSNTESAPNAQTGAETSATGANSNNNANSDVGPSGDAASTGAQAAPGVQSEGQSDGTSSGAAAQDGSSSNQSQGPSSGDQGSGEASGPSSSEPSTGQTQDGGKDAAASQANAAAPASGDAANAPAPAPASAPAGDEGAHGTSSQQKGAIAGSLLGAAAVAAAIGGLYAYRKRKEAAAYAAGQASVESKEDPEDDARGPPVSNLWLHQPAVWASAAGKSIRRAASSATSWRRSPAQSDAGSILADVGGSPYTTPPRGAFQVLRGRREARVKGSPLPHHVRSPAIPDAFIAGIAEEDSPAAYLTVPRRRSTSSESLASHFSYPYLAAMHRTSVANLSSSASDSGPAPRMVVSDQTSEIYITSPATLTLSPGDAVILTPNGKVLTNPHGTPYEDNDNDSIVSLDGLTEIPRPPPACVVDSRPFVSINMQPDVQPFEDPVEEAAVADAIRASPLEHSIPRAHLLSEKLVRESRIRSSIRAAKKASLRIANSS